MTNSKIIPYGHQFIDDDDIKAVSEALKADRITCGDKVKEFEDAVASYCGAKYAVAVSSGTAALHCACKVAGIEQGDEVITTPLTFFATVSSIMMCGGKPVLADIRSDTYNIEETEILSKITDKTKAILPVDFAGHPCDIEWICETAHKAGLVVIEDACHALGAEYNGKKIGSFADMTIFSFHPVKVLTTGEGGMILTDNEEYYNKLLMIRNHNINRTGRYWYYKIYEFGYNYRLSDISCALGISQLQKLDFFINNRNYIADMYNAQFSNIEEIITPKKLDYVKHAYHLYVIQLKTVDRDRFIEEMNKYNIFPQVHYVPIHYHAAFYDKYGLQEQLFNTNEYYRKCVSLPMYPMMTIDDIHYVIDTVKKVTGELS